MYPSLFIFSLSSLFIFYSSVFLGIKSIFLVILGVSLYSLFIKKKILLILFIQSCVAYYFYTQVTHYKLNNVANLEFSYNLVLSVLPLKNNFYRYVLVPLKDTSWTSKVYIVSRVKASPLDIVIIPPHERKYKKVSHLSFINIKFFDETFFSWVSPVPFFNINFLLRPSIVLPIIKFFLTFKEKIFNVLNLNWKNKNIFLYNNFFKSLFLGQKMENDYVRKLFEEWGIGHYLARSGLHIQIISKIIANIILFFGINQTSLFLIQSFFLLIFYVVSFGSISFFRALLMFLSYGFLYFFLKIKTTSLHTVSLSLIVVLFYNPFLFLQLGVQLTFLATIILSLMAYKK